MNDSCLSEQAGDAMNEIGDNHNHNKNESRTITPTIPVPSSLDNNHNHNNDKTRSIHTAASSSSSSSSSSRDVPTTHDDTAGSNSDSVDRMVQSAAPTETPYTTTTATTTTATTTTTTCCALELVTQLAALDTHEYATNGSSTQHHTTTSALVLQSRLDDILFHSHSNTATTTTTTSSSSMACREESTTTPTMGASIISHHHNHHHHHQHDKKSRHLLWQLSQHIHRLQSRLVSMEEQQQQVQDEQDQQWQQANARIHLLERAVRKWHGKTRRLQHKLLEKAQQGPCMDTTQQPQPQPDEFHNHQQQRHDQEQSATLEQQLQVHERLMRLERSVPNMHHNNNNNNNNNNSSMGEFSGPSGVMFLEGNRSRCSSRDTVFSDLDMAGLYPMEQWTEGDGGDDEEQSSASSTSRSVITNDEGVLRYRLGSDDCSVASSSRQDWSHYDYQLTFPRGTKIGLQFHPMLMDKPKKGLLDEHFSMEGNRVTKDGGYRMGGGGGGGGVTAKTENESRSIVQKETSLLNAFLGKSTPKGVSTTLDGCEPHAFLVCGHFGFDSQINVRPPVGARLLKVNDESVSEWTLEQIRDATHDTGQEKFTMTFRNEPLTQKQRDVLNKAVKAVGHQQQEMDETGGAGAHSNTTVRSAEATDLDDEKEEPSREKRTRFPFLHLNHRGGVDGRNEDHNADAAHDIRRMTNGDEDSVTTPGKDRQGARTMLLPFLSMNHASSSSGAKEGGRHDPESVWQPSDSDEKSASAANDGMHVETTPMMANNGLDGITHEFPIPGTPPSQKLKKSMKSMGKKFKGWMS